MTKTLNKYDIEDLLIGAKILGTGGGGEPELARPLIDEVYAKKKQFKLASLEEIPNDKIAMIVGTVGGGVSCEAAERVANLPRIAERPESAAVRALAEYLGIEPYAFFPSEIGPANTLIPMYIAAMRDACCVDCDGAGRAKPEISLSTTNVAGLHAFPLSIVTPFGETVILKNAVNDARAEDICRSMAVASGGTCGVARCATNGRDVRNAVVPNSISATIRIGRSIRETRERKGDPVQACIKASEGYLLFHGRVKSFKRKGEGGFMWGNIRLSGIGDFKEDELRIWFKNEYLITWLNQKPYATCPDTICVVDAKTSEGLSAWGEEFRKSREVAVVGRKAYGIWRTKRGLELFSPKHFGFKMEYRPIEDVSRESGQD
jgi:DUF917 family protein